MINDTLVSRSEVLLMASTDTALRESLLDLFERTRSVDLRHFEASSSREDLAELVAQVHEILCEGLETVRGISDQLAGEQTKKRKSRSGAASQGSRGRAASQGSRDGASTILRRDTDSLLLPGTLAKQTIHLCEGILLDLRDSGEQLLDALAPGGMDDDPEAVLIGAASCLNKVRQAASAIDRALAKVDGTEPRLQSKVEIRIALAARKEYARFRRGIHGSVSPSSENLPERLQATFVAFVRIRAKRIYLELRLGDRMELESMHQRVAAWLQGPEPRDLIEGRRLWQDCVGLAELLKEVNRRSELQDHDREAVAALLAALQALGSVERVPGSLILKAGVLLGRDDALDALVMNGNNVAQRWRSCLERIAASLSY
jgi:hypothetical protein